MPGKELDIVNGSVREQYTPLLVRCPHCGDTIELTDLEHE